MRLHKLTAGGAALSAVLASSCCVGPIVLAALGVGGVGAAAALAPYRPYFLAATAVLLGFAYYRTYRKPAASEACCVPGSGRRGWLGSRRSREVALWAVTAVAIGSAAFPYVMGTGSGFAAAGGVSAGPSGVPADRTVLLDVAGMTCPACETHVERVLCAVPGVAACRVSYATGRAEIEVASPGVPSAALVGAVASAGYRASIRGSAPSGAHDAGEATRGEG